MPSSLSRAAPPNCSARGGPGLTWCSVPNVVLLPLHPSSHDQLAEFDVVNRWSSW